MTPQQLEKNNQDNLTQFFKAIEQSAFTSSSSKMNMQLKTAEYTPTQENDLDIRYIGSKDDVTTWLQVASNSFSYPINKEIICNSSKNKSIELLLAYKDKQPVGTALIFENENKVGVHLISVLEKYRGQGIGQKIIQETVNFSKREEIAQMTLNACALNLDIFKRLGFKEHNKIKGTE